MHQHTDAVCMLAKCFWRQNDNPLHADESSLNVKCFLQSHNNNSNHHHNVSPTSNTNITNIWASATTRTTPLDHELTIRKSQSLQKQQWPPNLRSPPCLIHRCRPHFCFSHVRLFVCSFVLLEVFLSLSLLIIIIFFLLLINQLVSSHICLHTNTKYLISINSVIRFFSNSQ